MSLGEEGLFYVTLHSGGRVENTGCVFKCDLPSEFSLSDCQNWRVALVQLICDVPLLNVRNWGKKKLFEIVHVHLDALSERHGKNQILSQHVINCETASALESNKDFKKSANVHYFEPRFKRYFELSHNYFNSFEVRLTNMNFGPLFGPRQIVNSTSLTLEFVKLKSDRRQEHVPLSFSSHVTAKHPTNTQSNFRVDVPSVLQNHTSNNYYVALQNVTFSPHFSLFPPALEDEQRLIQEILVYDEDGEKFVPQRRDYSFKISELGELNNRLDLWSGMNDQVIKPAGEHLDFWLALHPEEEALTMAFESNDRGTMELNYVIAVLLGMETFNPETDIRSRVTVDLNEKFTRPMKLDTWWYPKKIQVYTNFVEPSPNGNTMSQTLGIFPVLPAEERKDWQGRSYITHEVKQLQFRPANSNIFSEYHVELRDETGELVRFLNNDNVVFMELCLELNK